MVRTSIIQAVAPMHADEVEIDQSLVRQLLAAQFPQWRDLPIQLVLPRGTDHAIFRLGDRLVGSNATSHPLSDS